MSYNGANEVGSDPLCSDAGECLDEVVDIEDAGIVEPAFGCELGRLRQLDVSGFGHGSRLLIVGLGDDGPHGFSGRLSQTKGKQRKLDCYLSVNW